MEFIAWEPGQMATQAIAQINDAITDEQEWDILFFAGHINKTEITAGELSIAPDISISISEISPQLSLAQQRGLNVAIFNSCTGLNIAQIIASSVGAVIINGIIGLQLYMSAGIVLPWLLPSIVSLAYVISVTRRKNHV